MERYLYDVPLKDWNKCWGVYFRDELRAFSYSTFKNKSAKLKGLSTLPEHTGKGYASYLVERFLMEARQRHCTHYRVNGGDSNKSFFAMLGIKINETVKL
jgi:GNAT superfamily N-acetyltransferase